MALIARGADTHRRAHTNRLPGQKHARWLNTTINTAHNSTYLRMDKSTVSLSSFNSSEQQTWRFLIKAPYLGHLSVIYDAENKGLSYFPSDENKGLKSIAEIRCSVIKSLITDSMASIRLVT